MRNSLQHFIFTCLFLFSLVACSSSTESESIGCNDDSIIIIPTATRQTDPDLFSPPVQPDGGDGAEYCPTPIPAETPVADFPEQFVTTEVVNLSLDVANQDLAATAVGDDMIAVAWISDGNVYVSLSRGGGHFQVRRVDYGSSVSLAFSSANRLHMVYDRLGEIFYRAADQGTHPADTTFIGTVGSGHNPQVAVDSQQWVHIIYEADGSIWHVTHLYEYFWQTEMLGFGERPTLISGQQRLGIPQFGSRDYILAYVSGNDVHVRGYGITPFLLPGTLFDATIPSPEDISGSVRLDAKEVDGQLWLYAAWMSERPFPDPSTPLYAQPLYEAVNPLFPNQVANPSHIYEGLNAVRWRTENTPFDAGLMQTIPVTNSNDPITFTAWGLAETTVDSDLTLRIGIDPSGGDNPDSPAVVWPDTAAPAEFTQFSVTVPAQGSHATLFLRSTLNTADVPGTAVWDTAVFQNGTPSTDSGQALLNGDFEGSFIDQDSFAIPEGWTPFYQDSENTPINGRDVYTVYAAWSNDGGVTWIGPEAITANRDLSGGTTGAIRPDVTPIISTATEPPSVSFFYIYETG
ncbi:MAG: hypothetical protein GY805_23740, partial [Chloroflexi bacterium]|nr:hypothetical protein [Chloroflexota bacterium]